jgi:tetratricopeptide (TPR) repeat protein
MFYVMFPKMTNGPGNEYSEKVTAHPPSTDGSELIVSLRSLMELEGEYVSHQTALFLLGMLPAPPEPLTSVSPRRRRNRLLGDRSLVFVFHQPDRLKPVQMVSAAETTIPVSTLEKTLLDLLTDMTYAPPLPELATFFAVYPYKPEVLLQLARNEGDTALKRACLFMAWAGRLGGDEIPWTTLKRTPIKLDPRHDGPLLWDGRFFTKVPEELLKIPHPGPQPELPPAHRHWIELRCWPPFEEVFLRRPIISLLNDPDLPWQADVAAFFETTFAGLSWADLATFLRTHRVRPAGSAHPAASRAGAPPGHPPSMHPSPAPVPPFPELFHRWVEANPHVLRSRRDEIDRWCTTHLDAQNLGDVEGALFFAHLLHLDRLVRDGLARRGAELFNAGRFTLIELLCERHLESGDLLPHTIYVTAARAKARQDKFSAGLSLLDQARKAYEEIPDSYQALGELSYTAANILRMMNRIQQSLAELFVAREYFSVGKDHLRQATVDCSLGNVYFAQGRPHAARSHYLAALAVMRQAGLKGQQASLLGNLGLVEYDSGRFQKAALDLQRAAALQRMLQNRWCESVALLSLGKVFLKMGHFSKALKVLRDCHRQRSELKHESGMYETAGLLAWLCELLGNSGAANAYWDLIDRMPEASLEPRAVFVVRAVRAMTDLYHLRLDSALTRYQTMLVQAQARDATGVELGDCLHGIGVCEFLLDRPTAGAHLRKAADTLAPNPLHSQLVQIRYVGGLAFPRIFPDVLVDEELQRFMDSQAFEPFWGHFVGLLQAAGTPVADEFLAYHVRKTPPSMLALLRSRFPLLGLAIRRIEQNRRRAAEFFTRLSHDGTTTIHADDVEAWRRELPSREFRFDGPDGKISCGANRARIRPKSIPHGIISQLLLAFPHPVDIEALYRAVWGTDFDPECDEGAFKSSLQRLQKLLRSITPAIRILRTRTASFHGGVQLSFSCPWSAVL